MKKAPKKAKAKAAKTPLARHQVHAPPPVHWVQHGWGKIPAAGPAPAPRHAPGTPTIIGGTGVAPRAKTHAKARKWSPDSDVALCSVRAVAESLRLALSVPVSDEDVLALYWSVAADADAGISILDALTAAQKLWGIPGPAIVCRQGRGAGDLLILGLDLPQPHAVVQHDGAWWSWGQPYNPDDFPGAVIEEAWAVQWRP